MEPVTRRAELAAVPREPAGGVRRVGVCRTGPRVDLSRLPAAYISVCEFDPLRDEGIVYAQRLVQAGVHAELHLYPGTFHGSTQFAEADVSKRMQADDIGALRRGLHGTATSLGSLS